MVRPERSCSARRSAGEEALEFVSLMTANMRAVHGQREVGPAISDMGPPDGYRWAVSVRSKSLATFARFPTSRTIRTASAFCSGV